ncbi:hypothetical protein [Clostridium sp. Marseille-P2415]|uniref:hypothetical protein n=1 Tax=Clostridium sp. Marseille-P2415 TaxID=1805471 RepID=UPI0013565C90|nr:hypothetical protein [Clostridium sp. Marseille-P2415]
MILNRNNRIYFTFVWIFSVLTLFLHMAALKLVYNSIDILLRANQTTSQEVKKEMALQVDNLKRYSDYYTNVFFLFCYLFIICAGIVLVLRKVNLKVFLRGYLIFGEVQVIGLALFIQIFNKYGLTEGFGRLRTVLRHKLFWTIAILLIIVYLLYGYLKKHGDL